MDISDPQSIKNSFEVIGLLDCLINCAATLSPVAKFSDSELSDWIKNQQVNFFGSVS